MPALSRAALHHRLAAALPEGSQLLSDGSATTPAVVKVPEVGRVHVYLWTVTPDHSRQGRPKGEHKIQLIIKGQQRGRRGSLQIGPDCLTVVLGFSPAFGVFVAWEAAAHSEFGYSANVQVSESLLEFASASGFAVDEPHRVGDGTEEVRIAFTPGALGKFLKLTAEANKSGLVGSERASFLLMGGRVLEPEKKTGELHLRARVRIQVERAVRDSRFGGMVREAYDRSCAVCSVQLQIIEGAHIIPVGEPESSDDEWNGIALCPNHHRLFDAGILRIAPDLKIALDEEAVLFLKEEGLDQGLAELLEPYVGERTQRPRFWTDRGLRAKMEEALRRRQTRSGGK